MKKFFSLILIVLLSMSFFVGCTSCRNESCEKVYNYNDVKNILIRFHVLANSDSDEDQDLKIKVKDEVISYLYLYLNNSKSLDESRKIILSKQQEVRKIALKVIRDNGYSYDVTTKLSKENFPEKSYGSITLPQGEYEAFRIIIGNGEGHNWWCVMFPPLCFIDVTKGEVEDEESSEKLDEEVEKNQNESESDEEPEVRCKLYDIFHDLFE